MALKSIFNAMKKEGYIIKDLELYLLSLNSEDSDRAIDVNAPSQAGNCMRANYYSRMQYQRDSNSIDPRTRRIFDNGSGVHTRLQDYLKEAGILLMDELPVHNEEENIQGHTDGLFKVEEVDKVVIEAGVLEIKSINSNGFTQLKDAKEEHKRQGLVYIFCAEERRLYLKGKYSSLMKFKLAKANRMKEYVSLYTHLKDGRKYTKEQKIQHQCELHDKMDNILFGLSEPITKAVFLYENKDNQELKEYLVSTKSSEAKAILKDVLSEYTVLNGLVKNKKLPQRPVGYTKSCMQCRYCNYKIECWN